MSTHVFGTYAVEMWNRVCCYQMSMELWSGRYYLDLAEAASEDGIPTECLPSRFIFNTLAGFVAQVVSTMKAG